jgi:hypothetical protein
MLKQDNMRVYVSGKITGEVHEDCFNKFEQAEILLQSKGHDVFNPMKSNHYHDKSWQSYMREDIKALMDCDAIYLLDDWNESKGAVIEKELAEKLNFKILTELL